MLRQGSYRGEQTLKLATGSLRHGSRSALRTLRLVAVVGLIAGRGLEQISAPSWPELAQALEYLTRHVQPCRNLVECRTNLRE
jgi:hypothetical protein